MKPYPTGYVAEGTYTYTCPAGHDPSSNKPITRCPATGCNRVLTRVGAGSRSPKGAGATRKTKVKA